MEKGITTQSYHLSKLCELIYDQLELNKELGEYDYINITETKIIRRWIKRDTNITYGWKYD